MKLRTGLLGALGVVSALGAWEAVSRLGIVPETSLPPASQTLQRLAVELGRPETWLGTVQTLAQAGVSVAICIALAVPLGILIGRVPLADRYTRSTIDFLRSVPGIALVPLLLLFIGAKPEMVISLAVFVAFWPLLIQTIEGARSVEPLALEMARAFRLGRARTLRRIVLPATTPQIITGLRMAITICLLVTVGAQLLSGAPGLGQQIAIANTKGDGLGVYAIGIWTGVLGILVNLALRAVEKRVLSWHIAATKMGLAA